MNQQAQTILVVEDNDFVRMQIVRYLSDAGFNCVEGATSDQGLEQLSDDVNLAIVDVRMEPVDGFDFIRSMKAGGYNIPVILVTGDRNPDILEKSQQWKVATVLMKPVQKDRLVSMVNRTMSFVNRTK